MFSEYSFIPLPQQLKTTYIILQSPVRLPLCVSSALLMVRMCCGEPVGLGISGWLPLLHPGKSTVVLLLWLEAVIQCKSKLNLVETLVSRNQLF